MTCNPSRTGGRVVAPRAARVAVVALVAVAALAHVARGQTKPPDAARPASGPATARLEAPVPPPATRPAATAPGATARNVPAPATGASEAPPPNDPPAAARADAWAETLNGLAALLAGKDLPALVRELEPPPVIRVFANDSLQTPERLLGATTGSKVLGAHAYDRTPATLASDIAEDFRSAGEAVPENIRQGMSPADETAAKRANETAAQWLTQVLQPSKGHVTGVIILWPANRSRSLGGEPKRATFVLIKAQLTDGRYIVRQITFGDPLETPQP